MICSFTSSGTLGPECKAICQTYSPCENYATCHGPTFDPGKNYTCECGVHQSGQYCQNVALDECPEGWYGHPICGPCNCPTDLGFGPQCQETDGTCICKVLFGSRETSLLLCKWHYLPGYLKAEYIFSTVKRLLLLKFYMVQYLYFYE